MSEAESVDAQGYFVGYARFGGIGGWLSRSLLWHPSPFDPAVMMAVSYKKNFLVI